MKLGGAEIRRYLRSCVVRLNATLAKRRQALVSLNIKRSHKGRHLICRLSGNTPLRGARDTQQEGTTKKTDHTP